MTGDMRGLFVIIKGQYRDKRGERFFNEVSEDYNYLGGYDPSDPETSEWYMLYNVETLECYCCSGDFDKVLSGVFKAIVKFHSRKRYLEDLNSVEQTVRSPKHDRLMREVIERFGDYYREEIEEQEDYAYKVLKDNTPLRKNKKRLRKRNRDIEIEKREVEVLDTTPQNTKVTHRKVLTRKKRNTKVEFL